MIWLRSQRASQRSRSPRKSSSPKSKDGKDSKSNAAADKKSTDSSYPKKVTNSNKPSLIINERLFEEIVLCLENWTVTEIPIAEEVATDAITKEARILDRFAKLNQDKAKNFTSQGSFRTAMKSLLAQQAALVYKWWIRKRQSLNKPLLRIYWPKTLVNDQNPELVFRARERERYKLRKKKNNDIEQYHKIMQHKKDLEVLQFLSQVLAFLDFVLSKDNFHGL